MQYLIIFLHLINLNIWFSIAYAISWCRDRLTLAYGSLW